MKMFLVPLKKSERLEAAKNALHQVEIIISAAVRFHAPKSTLGDKVLATRLQIVLQPSGLHLLF